MNRLITACSALSICLAASFAPSYGAAMESYKAAKIVAGSAVRVRATPHVSASEVDKLAFGTVLQVQQRTTAQDTVGAKKDYWYGFNAPVKGWAFGALLQDYDAKSPDKAAIQLVRSKLGKADKVLESSVLNFNEALEVSEFAKKAASQAKSVEAAGNLQLAYWQAVQQGLSAIPMNQEKKPPYATWLKTLGKQVFYHELAGGYYVDYNTMWKLADQYKKSPVGDVIAWQAAHATLGGECEGFLGCMSYRALITEGEYLKRYPKGRYVVPTLQMMNEELEYMAKEAPNQRADIKEINFAAWDKLLAPLSKSATLDKTKQYLTKIKSYR